VVLDSLLAGVMLFSSFAARTPNVQPNPDDYEVSIGLSHDNFHINRQWERELGEPYVDDIVWLKLDNQIYFKPEYMNKQSRNVKYLKIDWRSKYKDWSFGFTSRNDEENIFSQNFVTFISFGMSKKRKYLDEKIEVEITFDGYFPPNEEQDRDTFEFEDKFKVSWKLTDKIRIYNLGEVSKLQGKEFYKAKIGFEYSF
jgi:hypothetical protein|tara:strand:- start:157 stop:750 length:594 start_codon:yes stop_codon:yes gene_type:complete